MSTLTAQMEAMARDGFGAEDIAVKLDVRRENAWKFVQIYGGKHGRRADSKGPPDGGAGPHRGRAGLVAQDGAGAVSPSPQVGDEIVSEGSRPATGAVGISSGMCSAGNGS